MYVSIDPGDPTSLYIIDPRRRIVTQRAGLLPENEVSIAQGFRRDGWLAVGSDDSIWSLSSALTHPGRRIGSTFSMTRHATNEVLVWTQEPHLMDTGHYVAIDAHGTPVEDLSLGPGWALRAHVNNHYVAESVSSGGLSVINATSGEAVLLAAQGPVLSLDGRIGVQDEHEVQLVNLDGSSSNLVSAHAGFAWCWWIEGVSAPDGQWCAYVEENVLTHVQNVVLAAASSGGRTRRVQVPGEVTSLLWSQHGLGPVFSIRDHPTSLHQINDDGSMVDEVYPNDVHVLICEL